MRPDPVAALEALLHPAVKAALLQYKGNVILAGGMVLGAVGSGVSQGSDFDLFIHGCDKAKAEEIAAEITKSLEADHEIYHGAHAISFFGKEDKGAEGGALAGGGGGGGGGGKPAAASPAIKAAPAPRSVIQIIARIYAGAEDVLLSFDLPPCKMMAHYSPTNALEIWALPMAIEALRAMAFPAPPLRDWNTSTNSRLFKYMGKVS
jgi:hypothetical protein